MDSSSQSFTGLRGVFWPIHNHELKKFLPMSLMMMFILFNYQLLRSVKDALLMHAPAGGAETISFVKLYGVTPAAILAMFLIVKLANIISREQMFYVLVSGFLGFFALFAFVIHPYQDFFHLSLETINRLQATYPTFYWFIPVFGNWSISLFYIMAELWGSVVLSLLFWQLANEITKLSEAKRFYGLFGMIGNLGLIACGLVTKHGADIVKFVLPENTSHDALWEANLKFQMITVLIAGLCTIGMYYWLNHKVLNEMVIEPKTGSVKKKKPKMGLGESIKFIVTSPYLMLIATLILSYGVTINIVEGVWKSQIKIAFPTHNEYLSFMGNFSIFTGIATILLMILGNNLLRSLSWRTAASITPIMILVTSVLFFAFVYFAVKYDPQAAMFGTTVVMSAVFVGMVQNVMSKATKYSLFDATKNMAYIPLDAEVKLKGQAAVEVVGGRAGKSGGAVIQSVLLMLAGAGSTLSSLIFVLGPIVIGVALLWCVAVVALNKRFTQLTKDQPL